jgi:CysZ protein
LLKEIVIAVESYFRAHQFIKKHRLWKWIILPGLLYMVLFAAGMYFFVVSSNSAVSYLSRIIGIDKYLQQERNAVLSFFFLMGGIMVRIILLFFYF